MDIMSTADESARKRARILCTQLGISTQHINALESSFQRETAFRSSGTIPDYHCPAHCFWVAGEFFDLAEGILDQVELRHGFVAALWHDAAHPMHPHDCVNVLESANAYGTCAPRPDIEEDFAPSRVIDLIHATQTQIPPCEAPSSFREKGQLSLTTRFIRDADLLQTGIGPEAEKAGWTARLRKELGESLITDGSPHANARYIAARLTTEPGRTALRRAVAGTEWAHDLPGI